MSLPGFQDVNDEVPSFWNEENAQQLVINLISLITKRYPEEMVRKAVLGQLHSVAEKAKARTQPQYDLAFGLAALKFFSLPEDWQPTYEPQPKQERAVDVRAQAPQLPPEPVATTTDPNDRSKWTVEDWEREGVQFRPATFLLTPNLGQQTLQQPSKDRDRTSEPPTFATRFEEAPWGLSARKLASWAWAQCNDGQVLSNGKREDIAKVLSVLYYSGAIKEGALVPIGMGRKSQVRAPTGKA